MAAGESKGAVVPGVVLLARWNGISRSGDGVGGYYERANLESVELGRKAAVLPKFVVLDLQTRGLLRHYGATEGDILQMLLTHVDASGFAMFAIVGCEPAEVREAYLARSTASVETPQPHLTRPAPYVREAGRRVAREMFVSFAADEDSSVQQAADEFAARSRDSGDSDLGG